MLIIVEYVGSAVDVQRMAEEREMLEKSGSKLSSEHEDAKKKLWQLDMNMTRAIENVEKCVRDYNMTAMSIQLTPKSAKYAHGIEYELRFDSKGDTIEQMLSVDLKRVVKVLTSAERSGDISDAALCTARACQVEGGLLEDRANPAGRQASE